MSIVGTDPDPSLTGDMQFFDNYVPRLADGQYEITVTQSLVGTGEPGFGGQSHDVNQSFEEKRAFVVTGPRFKLDPSDIHREFPPPGGRGRFELFMPHLAMRKRALPWERHVFADPATPWVALLVLEESEILAPSIGSAAPEQGQPDKPNPTRSTSILLEELTTPEATVVLPQLSLQEYDNASSTLCQVIDIAPATFQTVVPSQQDLAYLSHVRKVSIRHKSTTVTVDAIGSQIDDGSQWFSVVIAGRLPTPPVSGGSRGVNIAHLVSLEGLANFVRSAAGDAPPEFPAGTKRVRLVSLASWTFTCLPEAGESFAELMNHLVPAEATRRDELLLRFPMPALPEQPTAADRFAYAALDAGYTVRPYATRQGESSFAWYRGPFAPVPVAPHRLDAAGAPFKVSGQAAVYDPTHGLFDLSYAAAFEIGRLAAVNSGSFAASLIGWRKRSRQLLDLVQHRMDSTLLAKLLDAPDGRLQAAQVLDHALLSRSFIDYMTTGFVDDIEGRVHAAHDREPTGAGDPGAKSTPSSNPAQALAAALGDPAMQQFLRDLDYEELASITAWLARLSLLQGVPFEYLVADARFLPAESLRFFHVDSNWLDTLIAGALSIGVQTTVDASFQSVMFDVIRDAVKELVHSVRDRLLGIGQPTPDDPGEGPMAGLLLRSSVVRAWPGLEVKAATAEDGTAIKLLRMDHLSSDVLLCLFPTVPGWVAINEPQEGLHFGLASGNAVSLRQLSGPDIGKLFDKQVLVTATTNDARLVQLAPLLAAMKSKLDLDDPLGPAQFALQMVDVPERFIYKATS